jgi:hypothetical protein
MIYFVYGGLLIDLDYEECFLCMLHAQKLRRGDSLCEEETHDLLTACFRLQGLFSFDLEK